jgi:hypothetical protein
MRISEDMRSAHQQLNGWWQILGGYVIVVWIVVIFLWRGWLQDAWFYALIIAIGVNGKMYKFNTTESAPVVRTGIDRLVRGYRRSLKRLSSSAIEPTTSMSSIRMSDQEPT